MRPCKACGFEPSPLDRHTSMSTRSSISPRSFCSPVARHRSLPSRPRVAGRRSRATGLRISPLECAVTRKCVCKSFGMCTYKSLDLKSIGMNSYKKYRVEGGLRSLQTFDLIRIFHSEARTTHKSLDLKSTGMNTYKECRGLSPSHPYLALGSGSGSAMIRRKDEYR
jgi:hypothetical protein